MSLMSWLQSLSTVILEPKKIKSASLNIIFFKLLTIGSTVIGGQSAEMGKAKQYLEQLMASVENTFPQVGSGVLPASSSEYRDGVMAKKKGESRGLIRDIR